MSLVPARRVGLALALGLLVSAGCRRGGGPPIPRPAKGPALRIVVMDPLADQLACACLKGYAQRRYPLLCEFLSKQLGRPVEFFHTEDLVEALEAAGGRVDLIIGQRSVVEFDAAETATPVTPIAALTGTDGSTELTGLFVVRPDDPARKLADLNGRKVLFGPSSSRETNRAAMDALREAGVRLEGTPSTSNGANIAALAVIEGRADAAVIPGYAMRLLEGCDTIDKGSLRLLARTAPVPFVTVFATDDVGPDQRREILKALLAVRDDAKLLEQMESANGFVSLTAAGAASATPSGWTDWRGPGRRGVSPHVPDELPAKGRFLWRQPLTGLGLSGIVATSRFVIVADKDANQTDDVWRCLAADTGEQLWELRYPAGEEMDYSNSPRATPVIHQGLVYLLGAFGDLHCVTLRSGRVLWKRNIVADYGAELPEWGMCAAPLIVGGSLIVNPGAPDASLVALDRLTGKEIWRSPGAPAAYGSFIRGRFGGVDQIVGYDAVSLGGWDPATGKRLWTLTPPEPSDFNVPTPIDLGGRLLVATENNGTRIYGFDRSGRIRPDPIARNDRLAPDTVTPVVIGGRVLGVGGELLCLDSRDGLATQWAAEDEGFEIYASLIAGNGRVLITSLTGELILIRAAADKYSPISRLQPFDYVTEVWSHPALVGDRFYVRTEKEVCCVLFGRLNR